MKKNTFKRFSAMALSTALLAVTFGGCANTNSSSTASNTGGTSSASMDTSSGTAMAPVDVTLFLWGDKPNQMDDVLAEFQTRTKEELNMNLNINWAPQADYPNNIKLKLSAGEDVDMCFDAPWMNMNTFILQGNYRDLTPYFNNDAYPGLKAAFSEEYLGNNLMGENADRVYGVPLTQSFGGAGMMYIRGDLREKYGLAPVTDLASLEAYLQKVVENEPSMIPFAMKKDASYGATGIFDAQLDRVKIAVDKMEKGMWDTDLAPGVTATLYVEDYKVKDCVLSAEPAEAKTNLPAPYNEADYTAAKAVREWYEKGYIEKDVITRDDAMAAFTSGKAASFIWESAQYNNVLSALSQSVEGSVLEVYDYEFYSANDIKAMKKGSYQAWNFICIPVTTSDEKTDRIMKFFDWMFTNTENHDLFEWGIEGKNFTAVSDEEYTYPESLDIATNYNFPGYELTWNPNFIRYPQGYPDSVLKIMKSANDPESYFDPLLSGFRFNGDPVKNELANPDFLTAKTRRDNLALGIFPDVEAEMAAIDKEMTGNKTLQEDIVKIKEEVVKQATVYLETRKAADEKNGVVYPTVSALEAQLK